MTGSHETIVLKSAEADEPATPAARHARSAATARSSEDPKGSRADACVRPPTRP